MPPHLRTVAIVSCAEYAATDTDFARVREAFATLDPSIQCSLVNWDDDAVDWSVYDISIIRSTWNYHHHVAAFLAWTQRVSKVTRLYNSPEIIAWNCDKVYLRELQVAGVPCIPSVFVTSVAQLAEAPTSQQSKNDVVVADAGAKECTTTALSLAELLNGDVIVKPTISAGSDNCFRFPVGQRAAAEAAVARLLQLGKTVLVQPYQAAIDSHGEIGLIYIDGVFSHAFTKPAIWAGHKKRNGYDPECGGGSEASPCALQVGAQVMEFLRTRFGGGGNNNKEEEQQQQQELFSPPPSPPSPPSSPPPLYVRVDMVNVNGDSTGPARYLVMEIELIEPTLYMVARHPQCALALAQACLSRCITNVQ